MSKEKSKVGIKLTQGWKQYVSLEPFELARKYKMNIGYLGETGMVSGEPLATRQH